MNLEQRKEYDDIVASIIEEYGCMFFLNGPAGTGMTFFYNTLVTKVWLIQKIVIYIASWRIVALLLEGGRIIHSMFKILLDYNEDFFCSITKNSDYTVFIRETSLIIWDELPMQYCYYPKVVDCFFRDIQDITHLFGGATIVFAKYF